MMNSINGLDGTQELLIKLLEQNPDDWGMRKKVVWFLYEAGYFREASKVVWNAPEIPPVDREIVFAARIVSKGQPSRAMRLLNAVVERNRSEPEKNLAMAKELVKGGMPLQATRFYGAATLSDKSLIDEDFEICLITSDSEEDDWSEVVQGESFPWDGPVDLSEADLALDEGEESSEQDLMMSGMTQPVPLKAPVQSMKDLVSDEEKHVDLRVEKKPRPLNPDKIATAAVLLSVQDEVDVVISEKKTKLAEEEAFSEDVQPEKAEEKSKELSSSAVEKSADEDESFIKGVDDEIEGLDSTEDESESESADSSKVIAEIGERHTHFTETSNEDSSDEEPVNEAGADVESEEDDFTFELPEREPVAAKKGMLSSFMGLFRRSKAKEHKHSDTDTLAESEPTPSSENVVKSGPVALSSQRPSMVKPITASKSVVSPSVVGPVKPKPVPVPAELQSGGGRKYGQPDAIDCRTRLVALAPQDGSAHFEELRQRYATLPAGNMPAPVTLARDEADVDYLGLIEQACSKDLESFSKLLGLHAVMTEADCSEWVEDMNLLRKGYGDAVLATVVSKYSVSECRDILGAVYRRTNTQAAV